MKFGILYCGFNNLELTKQSLPIWVEASKKENLIISSVSVPFAEYKGSGIRVDHTTHYLKEMAKKGLIKNCFDKPRFIQEAEARNMPLFYLLNENCDYIFIADSDEIYTTKQIKDIINFVKQNENTTCFKIMMKNYIFDGKHWMEGFNPFRIFKVNSHGGLQSFYWDNDVVYKDGKNQLQVETQIIPREIAFVKHMTWLHENGKQKYEYQMKHFGDCSYKWNAEKEQLELDMSYYKRHGYELPKIFKD